MRRLIMLVLGAAALSACAHSHHARSDRHPLWIGARFGQVATFDGHELWVDYSCGGERVEVRYLGAWADAVTPDGAVHRLNRSRRSGGGEVSYDGDGYRLRGRGLRPSWTAPGAQPVGCRGRV